MKRISQELKFRQAVFNYAALHGVTKAAIKYNVNRQFIYRMKWKFDGTPESLMPKSRRPNHHPKEHTEEEIQLIWVINLPLTFSKIFCNLCLTILQKIHMDFFCILDKFILRW